jgi:hypothetical protein
MSITVGELRRQLEGLSDNARLEFDGGLTLSEVDRVGDNNFVVLFREFQAELSPEFRKRHPSVLVAFCREPMTDERVQEMAVPHL